jgi:methanethiol S-methyltransferase
MTRILFIFLAFALIHSITVASWFKELCRRAFGETFMRVWYRFLYTLVSCVTAAVAIDLIALVPDQVLWSPPVWLRWLLHAVQVSGFLFGVQAFRYLDKWEFMGFLQVWRYVTKGEIAGNSEGLTEKELITAGVYGVVRHPLYVAGIIMFTFSPRITVNGLFITVLADLYFIFGMFIEERRFVKMFGDQYRDYMKKVPRMVPCLFSLQRRGRNEEKIDGRQ